MVLISLVSVFNLLYFYISTFRKYVCSAQYGCFLEFLHFFSASFLITFLSPEIATSINIHVPFSFSRIIMSGLLLGEFRQCVYVCTCVRVHSHTFFFISGVECFSKCHLMVTLEVSKIQLF